MKGYWASDKEFWPWPISGNPAKTNDLGYSPLTPGRNQTVDPPQGSVIYTIGALECCIGGVLLQGSSLRVWVPVSLPRQLISVAGRVEPFQLRSVVWATSGRKEILLVPRQSFCWVEASLKPKQDDTQTPGRIPKVDPPILESTTPIV